MLDVGWSELLVIAVILIVVVGPKDLPPMIRAFGKMTARLRRTAGEFRAQFDEALREAELDDLRQSVDEARKLNPATSLRDAINPLRQMGNDIKADLQKATKPDNKSVMPSVDDKSAGADATPILPEAPATLAGTPAELSEPAPAVSPAPVAPAAVATPSADVVSTEGAKPASRSRKPKASVEPVSTPAAEVEASAKRPRKPPAAAKAVDDAVPVKAAKTSKPRKTKTEDRA
ncbi:MAG: twin-arginine translocase subunit TatB [Shinella sp.]|nr:MAG: twin-arginine translocase subunit TatB [Shinella sp.]